MIVLPTSKQGTNVDSMPCPSPWMMTGPCPKMAAREMLRVGSKVCEVYYSVTQPMSTPAKSPNVKDPNRRQQQAVFGCVCAMSRNTSSPSIGMSPMTN